MATYFKEKCSDYGDSIADAPGKGRCSYADVVDRVANNTLNGMMSYLQTIAFAGIVAAFVLLYIVVMILIALNSNWDVCL